MDFNFEEEEEEGDYRRHRDDDDDDDENRNPSAPWTAAAPWRTDVEEEVMDEDEFGTAFWTGVSDAL